MTPVLGKRHQTSHPSPLRHDGWPTDLICCAIRGCVWRRTAAGAPPDWMCPDHDGRRDDEFAPPPLLPDLPPLPALTFTKEN